MVATQSTPTVAAMREAVAEPGTGRVLVVERLGVVGRVADPDVCGEAESHPEDVEPGAAKATGVLGHQRAGESRVVAGESRQPLRVSCVANVLSE